MHLGLLANVTLSLLQDSLANFLCCRTSCLQQPEDGPPTVSKDVHLAWVLPACFVQQGVKVSQVVAAPNATLACMHLLELIRVLALLQHSRSLLAQARVIHTALQCKCVYVSGHLQPGADAGSIVKASMVLSSGCENYDPVRTPSKGTASVRRYKSYTASSLQ